jgi:hypothetical protein
MAFMCWQTQPDRLQKRGRSPGWLRRILSDIIPATSWYKTRDADGMMIDKSDAAGRKAYLQRKAKPVPRE